MHILKLVLYCIICLSAGSSLAFGITAFMTLIGIFPVLGAKFKGMQLVPLIERALILGIMTGTILYMFQVLIPLYYVGEVLLSLFGGIYIGCVIGALSEVLNVIPILSKRYKIRKHLPLLLYALALGKLVGSLVLFYLF